MTREIRNAVVNKLFLEIEDHGIPAINIEFRYGGSSLQSTGMYDLRGFNFGLFVLKLWSIFGTQDLLAITGKPVRVEIESGMIRRVGHFINDNWIDMKDFYGTK